MSRRSWLLSVGCIACIASLFSQAAVASSLPLRATITFTEQAVPSTDPRCLLTGLIKGTGTAPRVGALDVHSNDCINPVSTTAFVFVSDDVVLQLADGEQIFAAYGGTLSNGVIRGSLFVFGGTGRFANATGVGTIEGSEAIDFQTGAGAGQIELKATLFY